MNLLAYNKLRLSNEQADNHFIQGMTKILVSMGFSEISQKGSHKKFKHDDGRVTVVPFHGEDLGRGLIRKILNDIEMAPGEYEELRKKV